MFKAVSLLLMTFSLLLPGCKIEVTVPDGGKVVSTSGDYECERLETCVVEVNDTSFDQKFRAIPSDGYVFGGWSKGVRRLCGGRIGSCALNTESFEDNDFLMEILASENKFYLEPIFYSSQFSGSYRMTPSRDLQFYCGEKLEYFPSGEAFEFTALHLDGHLRADLISPDEIPGATLVRRSLAVTPAGRRNFTQRAVFSHPSKGLIDYYKFYTPFSTTKQVFSGSYSATYVERDSGRICGVSSAVRAERLTDTAPTPNYTKVPDISGSYRLLIEDATIECSDGSGAPGPGVEVDIVVTQSGNMFSFDNPAQQLVEARTTPLHQTRYPVGGAVSARGNMAGMGFARMTYGDQVTEWTNFTGQIDGNTIAGTLEVRHVPGDISGQCVEQHQVTGVRLD